MTAIFLDMGLMIIFATFFAFIARYLKQPIIPAYIIGGIVLGPILGIITDAELIFKLSEIGIAFLLFIVGLELDFKRLKDIGLVASVGGLIQVAISFGVGFALSHILGFEIITSIYLGLVVAFSSTLVVVKLLQDKQELDALHGKIIIGILIMQDILAIFAISALTTGNGLTLNSSLISLAQGAGLLAASLIAGKYLFPKVFEFAAKSQEILLMAELAVLFVFALLFDMAGFSITIGAFVAGMALGNLDYRVEMIGRIKSLRDFFTTLFFTSLGLQLSFAGMQNLILPLVLFTLLVLMVKPFFITMLCGIFGFTKRTSFKVANGLAQVSEFSLIIVAAGLALGHIPQEVFTLTILLAIVTMTSTAYLMKYSDPLFTFVSKYLPIYVLFNTTKIEYVPKIQKYDIIVIGYDKIGYSVIKSLQKEGEKVLLVDYNPEVIKKMAKKNIQVLYGDVTDEEVIERINFHQAKLVISTVSNLDENMFVLKHAKKMNKKITVFGTANIVEDAIALYNKGADYVILPYFLGGEQVANILTDYEHDEKVLNVTKISHLAELKKRKELGQDQPHTV